MAVTARSRRVKPAGGFELAAWYFMRISGLFLVFLALGHLCIMHLIYNVESINYNFVSDRWTNPQTGYIWRLWDLTMVNLAILHGFNGLRQILEEWINQAKSRVILRTGIWIFAGALLLLGNYAILMFVKDADYLKNRRDAAADAVTVKADVERSGSPRTRASVVVFDAQR